MKPPTTALDQQLAKARYIRERKAARAPAEPVAPKPKSRPWDYTGRYKQGGAR
jgi:hypothetical protein